MKYCKVRSIQREFAKEMTNELLKHTNESINADAALEMVVDIVKYFDRIEDEYKMSQEHVRLKDVFRGFVTKDQKGADFNCKKHTTMNKILIKKAVIFHSKCWKNHNKVYYDEEKQSSKILKLSQRELRKHSQQLNTKKKDIKSMIAEVKVLLSMLEDPLKRRGCLLA